MNDRISFEQLLGWSGFLMSSLFILAVAVSLGLGQLIAAHLKLPFVVLSQLAIPEKVFNLIPERLARKQKVIAFARDQAGLKVAMAFKAPDFASWYFSIRRWESLRMDSSVSTTESGGSPPCDSPRLIEPREAWMRNPIVCAAAISSSSFEPFGKR